MTVNNCDDFKGRFEYLGDYDNYKCGIRISGVEKEDAGAWRSGCLWFGFGWQRGFWLQ